MTKFNYVSDMCGCDKPYVVKMRLEDNIDVDKGTILYASEQYLTVTTEKTDNMNIIGVCAKDYKATPDMLVPEYGSGEVSVIVSPTALYRADSLEFSIIRVNEDEKYVVTDIPSTEVNYNYGFSEVKIMLIEKGEDSTNTNAIGTVSDIVGLTINDNCIGFYVNSVDCSVGDKYAMLPPYGFRLLDLDENRDIVCRFDKLSNLFVVDSTIDGCIFKLLNMM